MISFIALTSGNRFEHPAGDGPSFVIGLASFALAFYCATRGGFIALVALGDKNRNFVIAAVTLMMNILFLGMLFLLGGAAIVEFVTGN